MGPLDKRASPQENRRGVIGKQDILDRAAEWHLPPEVVEKDYVLGWLLAAIGSHQTIARTWVFKGGTCLKKCYFETYRFSEDLDFSLLPVAEYDKDVILRQLREVALAVSEASGIEFPVDQVIAEVKTDKLGRPTFKGRIYYRGPLVRPTLSRVLIDITQHERVISEPVSRYVHHPYPDSLSPNGSVLAYSLQELLAEKTRALYERTRPRDLYDVVYMLDNRSDEFNLDVCRQIFHEKCSGKKLEPPSHAAFKQAISSAGELHSEWENMLGHQLPQLPPIESMLDRVDRLLEWVERQIELPARRLKAPPVRANQELVAPPGMTYWQAGVGLEAIRFAGVNRLMVEFSYNGRRRLVEPYSLRRSSTGNLLLYGWQQGATHIKAFNISKISNLKVTGSTFNPRYRIELASVTQVSSLPTAIPPSHRQSSTAQGSNPKSSGGLRGVRRRKSAGVKYVFKCSLCGKRFYRSKYNAKLGKHKTKDGRTPCPSRIGHFMGTT